MNTNTVITSEFPRFGVVLVNYKTPKLTEACLQLLRHALQDYDADVWVVDNDSNDTSTTHLRSLDWIKLIERKQSTEEKGFMAHGQALDLVLQRSEMEYLFLLHTDTLIYDPTIFGMMLTVATQGEKIFSVGCLEQLNRGVLRSRWRLMTRFLKYHTRRLKTVIGFTTKTPKYYRENHIKSFCALWNIRLLREENLRFSMAARNPGYEAQDKMLTAGYTRVVLSEETVFRYLDHLQAGTKSSAVTPPRRTTNRHHPANLVVSHAERCG